MIKIYENKCQKKRYKTASRRKAGRNRKRRASRERKQKKNREIEKAVQTEEDNRRTEGLAPGAPT